LARRSFRVVRLYDYFCKAFNPRAEISDIRSSLVSGLLSTGEKELLQLPEQWWDTYIQLILCKDSSHDELERELLEITSEIPIKLLTAPRWHDLFRICLFSGLFCVGQIVREKASEAYQLTLKEDSSDRVSISLALSQFLEKGDRLGALQALDRLAKEGITADSLSQGYWFCDLLCSGDVRPLLVDTGCDSVEQKMLRAVSGKTVAIVGPVPPSSPSGEEIDRCDLVVKFNYRGGDQGCDPKTQGSRVDVSYYNIDQSKYIAKGSDVGFLNKLMFPVFIKNQGFSALRKKTSSGRAIKNAQWLLFGSEFHAGTNAALDIFSFSPRKVTIFNSDLMLTAGRYKGYWRPGTKEVNYCLSFGKTHDPIMQYNYLHLLWSRGILSGDDRFSEIMSQGLDKYIIDLQSVHGLNGKAALLGL
jgi:hypothetical protein